MSFRKFKSDSYCVGEVHWSATAKIYGGINSKGSKVLIGYCSIRNRKKSMIVSDNTKQVEGLGSFFKNLGRISAKAGEKLATNVFKNSGGALEITSSTASSTAPRSPKTALSSCP